MRAILLLSFTAMATGVVAQDYSTPYGAWRGQTQYQAKVGHAIEQSAHAVVPLVVEVDPAGRFGGISNENGCKLLGVATPGVAAHILSLDVTLSGCQYAGFNRRYSGMLALYSQGKYATLTLNSQQLGIGQTPFFADIKATMRR